MSLTGRYDVSPPSRRRPEIEPGLRRSLLARFPYGLIYTVEEQSVIVIAVAHLHREPRYWMDRA